MKTKLVESDEPNRLTCPKCEGKQFFINTDAAPGWHHISNNVECVNCHAMLTIETYGNPPDAGAEEERGRVLRYMINTQAELEAMLSRARAENKKLELQSHIDAMSFAMSAIRGGKHYTT